ncbi:hypothetical protein JCM31826_03600 [Thermaurantimonas aggregans]|uniref:Sensory transduction regulator n=1 Tax=Thermaurantimonas aggregans TaxID=2173829 RepID=A0A401XIQ8_9FLAO|nr:hypothetical protein [Thermaurantimonas aggregans]MCX8148821.1 hypothetical protein [Thermaurantimonas aggregans]GCD76878.1 hypothetical protein JCM31826_03600 [Thermaurantimonas aggregans]
MKTLIKTFVILIMLLVVSVQGLFAQDKALEQQLNRAGLKFSYDNNSRKYKLVFDLSDGRSQVVLINGWTYDLGGFQIREIYSPVATLQNKTDFSQRVLFNLLEKNFDYKIGNWQIHGGEPPFILQYSIKINSDINDDVIRELLSFAVKVADAMEKELTGTDDY